MSPELDRIRDDIRFHAGCVQARIDLAREPRHDLAEMGFQAFSQFGEDGILQYLVRATPSGPKSFVEIGVEDYRESNTRFLASKDAWHGLIVDASPGAGEMLAQTNLGVWRGIDFVQATVTRENVNDLLAPMKGEIGILSIDIDSYDYHVWEAIQVVHPRIVVIEYRPFLGPDLPLTVPYSQKAPDHPSALAYGASLNALVQLAHRKGYLLVGTSDGPNAFFVREDALGSVRPSTPAKAWKTLHVREGAKPYRTDEERRRAAGDAEFQNVVTGEVKPLREWFAAG
jgi:hypothetical protein